MSVTSKSLTMKSFTQTNLSGRESSISMLDSTFEASMVSGKMSSARELRCTYIVYWAFLTLREDGPLPLPVAGGDCGGRGEVGVVRATGGLGLRSQKA